MIRILLVDDHPALRAGLTAVLRAEPGLVPLGTAASEEDGEIVGATVEVGYDPDDPQTIVLGGGASSAAGTAMLGLGIGCDVVGVVLLILSTL